MSLLLRIEQIHFTGSAAARQDCVFRQYILHCCARSWVEEGRASGSGCIRPG